MRSLGPDAGVAQLNYISGRTCKLLLDGFVVSSPSELSGGTYSLCIQRKNSPDPNEVLVDTLFSEHRGLLPVGCRFDIKAGKKVLASGIVTVSPGESEIA